jgi:hypothetical protein
MNYEYMNSALIIITMVHITRTLTIFSVKSLNFESEFEGPNVLDLTVTILLLSWSQFQLRDLQLAIHFGLYQLTWLQISIIWRCLM